MKHHSRKTPKSSMEVPSGLTFQLKEKILALPEWSVRTAYLKSEVFSKYVSAELASADVRRARAVAKWLATERNNDATNDRLLTTPPDYNILPRVRYDRFLDTCQRIVADVLGDTPSPECLIGTFSGGASTSRNRTESHPSSKYLGQAHVTPQALSLFNDIVADEVPGWLVLADLDLIEVRGNVMFTVPKETDIDRVACKEPDINMFLQKGIGNDIRRKLRRVGIDLNDQGVNRSLARKGSVDQTLATLDLSSASDSISSGLVFELLPICWYTLLDSVRSPITVIDGEEHRNHMFSSMGNGFTFELESLLFYAITRATAYHTGITGRVSVYGDDIICPTGLVPALETTLSYLGFQVNPDKSWSEGYFRESCGGHYYDGLDLTPFYIKAEIRNLPELIDVANKLRKWALWGQDPSVEEWTILDPDVEEIWLWLKSFIPECLWGGSDLTFRYQLVSLDTPRKRLTQENKRVDTKDGGYYFWLNATWDRRAACDGIETSSRQVDLPTFRFRPVRDKSVPRLVAAFLHEEW